MIGCNPGGGKGGSLLQKKMKDENMKFKILAHTNQKTIDQMYNDYSPVFILSTGRSGSKFLATLLDYSENVTAYHEPKPMLTYFSNYAFHHQQETKVLTHMINAARMELILTVFIKNKIYVESNQCLTFFAPSIANLFKKSIFVHVVRHPGDFVTSAVKKGWHKNDSIWEAGRVKMADKNQWNQIDQIERLSWLWYTTNHFIEEFKKQIETRRIITTTLEKVANNTKEVKKLLEFASAADIKKEKINELQKKKINELHIHPDEPPNMKKTKNFPAYNQWNNEMKQKLIKYSGHLARQFYGYQL